MANLKSLPVIWTLLATISANFTHGGSSKYRPLIQPRIYSGRSAKKGQFPYQVLVISEAALGIYSCGGSIISRDYILTAAHCVDEVVKTPERISVYAGTIYYITGGIKKRVSLVTIHPEYGDNNNDIAVLKLNSSLEFNSVIDYIPLAKADIPNGAQVIVSGWGYVNNKMETYILQYDIEYSMSRAQCQRRLGRLGDTMRCMRRPVDHGLCSGDSGGPAAHKGKLIGVSSYIIGDCGRRFPDVFTDVVATRKWILKIMQ